MAVTQKTKLQFVELRAEGMSYDKITQTIARKIERSNNKGNNRCRQELDEQLKTICLAIVNEFPTNLMI